jgi:hypothetical protein
MVDLAAQIWPENQLKKCKRKKNFQQKDALDDVVGDKKLMMVIAKET